MRKKNLKLCKSPLKSEELDLTVFCFETVKHIYSFLAQKQPNGHGCCSSVTFVDNFFYMCRGHVPADT